jgi:hypothetical protein
MGIRLSVLPFPTIVPLVSWQLAAGFQIGYSCASGGAAEEDGTAGVRFTYATAAGNGFVQADSGARKAVPAKYTVLSRRAHPVVETAQFAVEQEPEATLVSVFAGQKPTGGYVVTVTGVDRLDTVCTVRYRVESPPADMMVTQALTYPAATVRITPACKEVKVAPPLPRARPLEGAPAPRR